MKLICQKQKVDTLNRHHKMIVTYKVSRYNNDNIIMNKSFSVQYNKPTYSENGK